MKLLLKSAVIAFSAIGIVLSSHTISYAAGLLRMSDSFSIEILACWKFCHN